MVKKIVLFKKEDYDSLKKKYLETGYEIYSITQFLDDETNLSDIEDMKMILDLSSLNLVKYYNDDYFFKFEEAISRLDENILYIAEDPYNELVHILKYVFNEIEYFMKEDQMEIKNIKYLTDLQDEEIDDFGNYIDENLFGQKEFKKNIRYLIKQFRFFYKIKEERILSLFIMGKSGVGKTEFAKLIYKYLGGNGEFIKINFGNYSSRDSLNSLIGSPRGYMGSETGELFSKFNKAREGIILIDEFEKANEPVFNYFLELLETGYATNSQGKSIDLNGFTIIFTSNVIEEDFYKVFSPELISRFQYICDFEELDDNDKQEYMSYRINKLTLATNKALTLEIKSVEVERVLREQITFSKFDNIRILNREINRLFLNYLTIKELF